MHEATVKPFLFQKISPLILSFLATLLVIISLYSSETHAVPKPHIPQSLNDWKGWVMDGWEFLDCPYLPGQNWTSKNAHHCSWPGKLKLDLQNNGGLFSVSWSLKKAGWASLPGGKFFPLDVKDNGKPVVVIHHNGQPSVWLTKGTHKIKGRFDWNTLPNTIHVPEIFFLIDLKIEQKKIAAIRQATQLSLHAKEETKKLVEKRQNLIVDLSWRLNDGLPMTLDGFIKLDLQGQAQEVILGTLLPDNFHLTSISSGIPLKMDKQGRLIAQINPGTWEIHFSSRSSGAIKQFSFPENTTPWPQNFLLAFQAKPQYRFLTFNNVNAVDARFSDLISRWEHLPSYIMHPGTKISWNTKQGAAETPSNQLSLQRSLWLSLDGNSWQSEDYIDGTMYQNWRLDLSGPLKMNRAQSVGDNLLITQLDNTSGQGVELRAEQISLTVGAKSNSTPSTLPVHGYSENMQAVDTQIYLPPGYRVLAAPQADSAYNTWVSYWDVLNLFLVTLGIAIFWRLGGLVWASIAALYLVPGYHESAPFYPILALGISALIYKHLGSGKRWMLIFQSLVLLSVIVTSLPYAMQQIRAIVHQQLDPGHEFSLQNRYSRNLADYNTAYTAEPAAAPRPQKIKTKQAMPESENTMALDRVTSTGSRISAVDLIPRPVDILLQAGRAKPGWNSYPVELQWNAPVTPEQNFTLWLITPWMMMLIRILILASMLLLILKSISQPIKLSFPRWPFAATLFIVICMSSYAQANNTPDAHILEKLEQKLTKAPQCAPHCVSIPSLSIELHNDVIILNYQINAHQDSAISLPVPPSSTTRRFTLNGTPIGFIKGKKNSKNNHALFSVKKGLHRLQMQAKIEGDQLNLHFSLLPGNIRAGLEGWTINGIVNTQLSGNQLSLIRKPVEDKVLKPNQDKNFKTSAITLDEYIKVQRSFFLDKKWSIRTKITVLSPKTGIVNIQYPLLQDEHVSNPDIEIIDNNVLIQVPAGKTIYVTSQLKTADKLIVRSPQQNQYFEEWAFYISPIWHIDFLNPDNNHVYQSSTLPTIFQPMPGQQIALRSSQPIALVGETLSIDKSLLSISQGQRQTSISLDMDLRSTRIGSQNLRIPSQATIESILIDGRESRIRPVKGTLSLPVKLGEQHVKIQWNQSHEPSFASTSPSIDLGISGSNAQIEFELPGNRWVLFTHGTGIGPIVLYWPQLLALIFIGIILGKIAYTPLKTYHWVLLGMGFSTYDWRAFTLAILWFHVLAWREKQSYTVKPGWFNAQQFGLSLFSLITVFTLISAIPNGLLAYPDMRINGILGEQLRWFIDVTDSQLPQATIYSAPLWVYRGLMLLWALWLALKVMDWAPWAYKSLSKDGYWIKPSWKGHKVSTAQHSEDK